MANRASSSNEQVNAAEADALPIAASRHPLVAEVRNRLVRYAGVRGRVRIVAGVSGGADSMALLVALLAIRAQQESEVHPDLTIAHVNHHLRQEAEQDAAFVQAIGDRFGVPVVHADVHPATGRGNIPATARSMRYEALATIARERDAPYIAAAHHAEDQFESVLMALCRGAGLDGMGGMAWTRPLGENITLVRPLLASRRADCESLCAAAGIAWREDASNRDLSKSRNRLRHEVLPNLESMWPDAPARVGVTAQLLQTATRLLERELARAFGPADQREWDRNVLATLPPVLIAAGLRRAALAALGQDQRDGAEELTQRVLLPAAEAIGDDDRSPREFTLTSGVTLTVRSKLVSLHA